MLPYLTSAGNVCIGRLKFFHALPMSANDQESTMGIDSGVTNTLERVGEFANIESANNNG